MKCKILARRNVSRSLMLRLSPLFATALLFALSTTGCSNALEEVARAGGPNDRTSFPPPPPPPPPQVELRELQTAIDVSPLVVARDEPLVTFRRVPARVQLARGADSTWAVLASDDTSTAPVFWLAAGADRFRVARGQEGTLLAGELALLQQKRDGGATLVAAETTQLRPLTPNGWGTPRALTPEQGEALRVAGSAIPAYPRAAFDLDAAGARHAFQWGVGRLLWSFGGEQKTLCACDSVFRAAVDPQDGSPTLLVAEGGGASVYSFTEGHWSRTVLVPRDAAQPAPATCAVTALQAERVATLPAACTFVSRGMLALDGAMFAGEMRAVWAETRREDQLQCVGQMHPCDPSGPHDKCAPREAWSCSTVTRSSATSLMQATIGRNGVRVAPLDGLVPAQHDNVSLVLRADDAAAHLALASGALSKVSSTVRHLELAPKGSPSLAARPVLALPPPKGPFASEDSLLANGFSGFGPGFFDGGTLELRTTAYRSVTAPSSGFRFEIEARFGSTPGHGVALSGELDTVELLADAAEVTLNERQSRTESTGPLERVLGLASRKLDASRLHRYTFVVSGEQLLVSIDGERLGTGRLRGGVQRLRFGCVGSCSDTSSASVWGSLSLTSP